MSGAAELEPVDALTDAQVHDLWRLYQGEWWTETRTLDETRRIVAGSTVNLGLIEPSTARLVAYCRAISDGVTKALVLDVVVAPSHRGLGLGAMQVERLLRDARLCGVRHFELYCRPELMPFYERFGFTAALGALTFMRR